MYPYIYDGAGNRVKEVQGNQERRFLVAPAMGGGLESTDLITDGSGNLISNYIYGSGSSPFMRLDADGNAVYYLTDAMGSVIGKAMAGYAHKWQQLPFVSYISLAETGFGESKVSKTDKQQAKKEAFKQGVILLLVNLSGQ